MTACDPQCNPTSGCSFACTIEDLIEPLSCASEQLLTRLAHCMCDCFKSTHTFMLPCEERALSERARSTHYSHSAENVLNVTWSQAPAQCICIMQKALLCTSVSFAMIHTVSSATSSVHVMNAEKRDLSSNLSILCLPALCLGHFSSRIWGFFTE